MVFLRLLNKYADSANFQSKPAFFVASGALCPFSELGFSLTLAEWSAQSGTFARRRLNCQIGKVARRMKIALT